MDVDRPESFEEQTEQTIRDEIASVQGPAALAGFTVRARRDPDRYDRLRILLLSGENRHDEAELHLEDPSVRADLDHAIRRTTRDLLARISVVG